MTQVIKLLFLTKLYHANILCMKNKKGKLKEEKVRERFGSWKAILTQTKSEVDLLLLHELGRSSL